MTLLFAGAGIALGGVAFLLFLVHDCHARSNRVLSDVTAALEKDEARDV